MLVPNGNFLYKVSRRRIKEEIAAYFCESVLFSEPTKIILYIQQQCPSVPHFRNWWLVQSFNSKRGNWGTDCLTPMWYQSLGPSATWQVLNVLTTVLHVQAFSALLWWKAECQGLSPSWFLTNIFKWLSYLNEMMYVAGWIMTPKRYTASNTWNLWWLP